MSRGEWQRAEAWETYTAEDGAGPVEEIACGSMGWVPDPGPPPEVVAERVEAWERIDRGLRGLVDRPGLVMVGSVAWTAHPEDAAQYSPSRHACAGCGGLRLRSGEYCLICSATRAEPTQHAMQAPKLGAGWDGTPHETLDGGTGRRRKRA